MNGVNGSMDDAGPCSEGGAVRGQPGTVPRFKNVCQCSQPRDQRECRSRCTCRSTQTQRNTHAPAFHSIFSPCFPHSHSFTDNPANEGAAAPPVNKRLECSEGFWPVETDLITVDTWAFGTGNALMNKSWRTTWWYCVTTKNCSN